MLAAILLAAWLVSGIEPAGSWDDLMDFLSVTKNRGRYTMLAVAGVVATVIVAVARILGYGRKEDE